MRTVRRILLLTVALSPALSDVLGGPTSTSIGDGVVIEYSEPLEREAAVVFQLYPTVRNRLRTLLGVVPPEPVRVRLCSTDEAFREITGGRSMPETLGMAFPAQNLVVINCARTDKSAYNGLRITIRHEICHLAIGAICRAGGRRVPHWFNEGVAVHTSGRLPLSGRGLMPVYVSSDVALPLEMLDDSFPSDSASLQIAYEQSADIIRFIVGEYSPRALRRICTGVKDGQSFEEALGSATGLTMTQLEEKWLDSMGVGNSILAFVLRNFSVMVIGSALVMVAFARYLVRRKKAMARWEREETVFPRDE